MTQPQYDSERRRFLQTTAMTTGTALMSSLTRSFARGDEPAKQAEELTQKLGKAEHCVMMWLGGGACQIDTFDPKAVGDPKGKKAGSLYKPIDTSVPGIQLCEFLPQSAKQMERMVPVRSVNHDVIDEHAAAMNRMHTGRPTSETIVYPSLGSVIVDQKGPLNQNVPSYVLIGYPSPSRGPGFLGASSGYVYLTDTQSGPAGFSRPYGVDESRQSRRDGLLKGVRDMNREQIERNPRSNEYNDVIDAASRLSGPEFQKIFQLQNEPDSLRNRYGGEFGQRCLLTRRLLQNGVRFVEVSHNLNFLNGTGWDIHNEGALNQHKLIQELDAAIATLIDDLEQSNLLEKTLVVVSTEFGRPAQFDGRGGRGHHGKSFSVVLAGGGLRTGQAVGTTDELGMKIVDEPVSVPDLFATIYATMGINPATELYAGDRPVPITDHGKPIAKLFS